MSSATKSGPVLKMIRSILRDVTPVRLRLFLVGNFLISMFLSIIAIITITQHQRVLQEVGHNAAPSVEFAHRIKSGIFKMEGSLSDELLSKDPDEAAQALLDFEAGRRLASNYLVDAAENITYGNSEKVPIQNIQFDLGAYLMRAQRARDLSAMSHAATEPGKTMLAPANLILASRSARSLVEDTLAPNAESLSKKNIEVLEAQYADERSMSALSCSLVLALGLFLLGSLVVTQIYMRVRFRRTLNPLLFVLTILTALFTHHVYSEVTESAKKLALAKEESFDSILAIVSAHSSLYAARSAQSCFLLDRQNAAKYQKIFDSSIEAVAKFSEGHNFETTIATAEEKLREPRPRINLPGMTGFLADEFVNIEYPGEGTAALDVLICLKDYVQKDRKMRALEQSGAHEDAVKVCISYNPQGVKSSFLKLDDALERALKINKYYFDQQVEEASKDLAGLISLAAAFAITAGICLYAGISPRILEYLK